MTKIVWKIVKKIVWLLCIAHNLIIRQNQVSSQFSIVDIIFTLFWDKFLPKIYSFSLLISIGQAKSFKSFLYCDCVCILNNFPVAYKMHIFCLKCGEKNFHINQSINQFIRSMNRTKRPVGHWQLLEVHKIIIKQLYTIHSSHIPFQFRLQWQEPSPLAASRGPAAQCFVPSGVFATLPERNQKLSKWRSNIGQCFAHWRTYKCRPTL